MENNRIQKLLKTIGKKIRTQRASQDLQPEDVAEMTGLNAATIRNIENGNETYLSNFFVVCLAINIHPKEILEIEIDIKPVFELSEPRKEKTRLTPRIEHYLETDFFLIDRTAKDVVKKVETDYQIKTTTSAVSVILKRKVKENVLKSSKKGRFNVYKKV